MGRMWQKQDLLGSDHFAPALLQLYGSFGRACSPPSGPVGTYMKKIILLVLLGIVAAVSFLVGTRYNHGAAAKVESATGRKVLYYVDPMHPAYKSDKPGIAPDCGMQLEPVYADGPGNAAEGSGAPRPAGAVDV